MSPSGNTFLGKGNGIHRFDLEFLIFNSVIHLSGPSFLLALSKSLVEPRAAVPGITLLFFGAEAVGIILQNFLFSSFARESTELDYSIICNICRRQVMLSRCGLLSFLWYGSAMHVIQLVATDCCP